MWGRGGRLSCHPRLQHKWRCGRAALWTRRYGFRKQSAAALGCPESHCTRASSLATFFAKNSLKI